MSDQHKNPLHWLHTFASLNWYEETIKFIFNFVTKTSELLLAAGIIVSTANFLTDGDIMSHNKALSDVWSWAQVLAIDSSLGIVFMNAFQAMRERDKIKAIIFFILTTLLATVAGLITHFDAYSHASGLPVSDQHVSGILPLWVMTALRAVAVIGFLLASRLKNISFNKLRGDLAHESVQVQEAQPETVISSIDYTALASAVVSAMQQTSMLQRTTIVEEELKSLRSPQSEPSDTTASQKQQPAIRPVRPPGCQDESTEMKIAQAYEILKAERAGQQDSKPISARDLAKYANVRRSTCSEWLRHHGEGRTKPSDLSSVESEAKESILITDQILEK